MCRHANIFYFYLEYETSSKYFKVSILRHKEIHWLGHEMKLQIVWLSWKNPQKHFLLKGLLGNQENPLFLPTLQHPNTAWTLVGLFSSLSVLFLGHFFIFYSLFFFFLHGKKKSDTDSFILKSWVCEGPPSNVPSNSVLGTQKPDF